MGKLRRSIYTDGNNTIYLILLSLIPYFTTYIGLYLFSSAWVALLAYHGFIILFVILNNNKLKKAKFTLLSKKLFFVLVILTSLVGPIIYIMWNYIKLPGLELNNTLENLGLYGYSFIIFIIYFSLVHPVIEELYWRITITYNKHDKKEYLFDFLFAGYHFLVLSIFIKIQFIVLSLLVLAIAGMVWRYFTKRNDFLTPIVTHGIADFLIIATIYILAMQ